MISAYRPTAQGMLSRLVVAKFADPCQALDNLAVRLRQFGRTDRHLAFQFPCVRLDPILVGLDCQDVPQTRFEFYRIDRFLEEIRGAQSQCVQFRLLVAGCGENDHRQIHESLGPPQVGEDVQAADVRHHDVQKDNVRLGLPDQSGLLPAPPRS